MLEHGRGKLPRVDVEVSAASDPRQDIAFHLCSKLIAARSGSGKKTRVQCPIWRFFGLSPACGEHFAHTTSPER